MIGNLFKAAVGLAVTPIDVAADAITLGGALSGQDESYTGHRLREVMKNLDRATDPDKS